MVVSEAVKEGVWMKQFMTDFGVVSSVLNLIIMFCDNMGVIVLVKELRFRKKIRYIKRCFNFIFDYVEEEDVNICKVYRDLNVSDSLIKFFLRVKYD